MCMFNKSTRKRFWYERIPEQPAFKLLYKHKDAFGSRYTLPIRKFNGTDVLPTDTWLKTRGPGFCVFLDRASAELFAASEAGVGCEYIVQVQVRGICFGRSSIEELCKGMNGMRVSELWVPAPVKLFDPAPTGLIGASAQ